MARRDPDNIDVLHKENWDLPAIDMAEQNPDDNDNDVLQGTMKTVAFLYLLSPLSLSLGAGVCLSGEWFMDVLQGRGTDT